MKFLVITSLLTVLSVNLFAQSDDAALLKKDAATGTSAYEEVIKAPGVKKEELYARAKKWILANIKTQDNNISFNDNDFSAVNTAALKVDEKNFFSAICHGGVFDFKFNVTCKDERYKIRIDNIVYYVQMGQNYSVTLQTFSYDELKDNKQGRFFQEQANDRLKAFVAAFEKYMEHPTEGAGGSKKDDW